MKMPQAMMLGAAIAAAGAMPAALATSPAGPGGALEYRPGDTEIYENGSKGLRAVKYRISAHAQAISRRYAKVLAIKAWEAGASSEFGADYAVWRLAQGRIMTCDPPRQGGITCSVSAIPGL